MVNNKFNGAGAQPAFIQFSEKLLRHTAGLKRLDAAVPVLIMMAQYTSGVAGEYKEFNGGAAAVTLLEKLNSLLATIENDLAEIIAVENQRVVDFNAFIVAVDSNIEQLNATISDLETQIQKMEECISNETKIFSEASNKFTRNTDLGQRAVDMCKRFVEEVEAANNSRRIEMDVISEIFTLLQVRFGKVPQDMLDYMESIKTQFAEYENRTKFIKVEIYKYAALVENELGKDIVADKQNYVENVKF